MDRIEHPLRRFPLNQGEPEVAFSPKVRVNRGWFLPLDFRGKAGEGVKSCSFWEQRRDFLRLCHNRHVEED